jgi:sortase A
VLKRFKDFKLQLKRMLLGSRTIAVAGSGVGALSCLVGLALIAQPYLTDLLADRDQHDLSQEFERAETRIAYEKKELPERSPVTRLIIPKLGVDTIVVEGTTEEALKTGAGHYPGTPLPGELGNVAIAGHRTTYGKPFNRLDELVPGDRVTLETPTGTYEYEMVAPFDGHPNPWVVEPTDFSVIDRTPEPTLTLTTCHPKGSARQRLIARLKLLSEAA